MSVDLLPLGVPFTAGEVFLAALRAAETLEGVVIHDNPQRASALDGGDRVVWLEDVSDGPADGGIKVNRDFRFNLGAINRTENARRGVHTDYRAAKRVLDAALPGMKSLFTVRGFHEGALTFRVENVDVGGGLIIAQYTLAYRDPGTRD